MVQIKKTQLIVFEPDTFERSDNGTITGVIYFDFGDFQFPEIRWNDFVVVIVGWWIEAMLRLSNGLTRIEDLKFMDGPLKVRITTNGNRSCTVECIDNGRGSVVEYSKTSSIDELLSAAMHTGSLLLGVCEANNWCSEDLNLLKKLVKV